MNEENEVDQIIEIILNDVAVMADHFEPDTEFEISEEV